MVKAVFTHKASSPYDDLISERYHFPRSYLRVAEQAIGDWIVYYEPRRTQGERAGGRQAYFAVARVRGVHEDPDNSNMYYAEISDYLDLPTPPRFSTNGVYLESGLQRADGATSKGAFGRSIRPISDEEFFEIYRIGTLEVCDEKGKEDWVTTTENEFGLNDPPFEFERPIIEQLTARRFRDAAFARQVKAAYENRCAVTGLRILNGGGRPEVQAAHIRAVGDNGPDAVRNGLALSGTAHWMFDRGLIGVSDDYRILVARNALPKEARKLIRSKLILPQNPRARPHPRYLKHHRTRFNISE